MTAYQPLIRTKKNVFQRFERSKYISNMFQKKRRLLFRLSSIFDVFNIFIYFYILGELPGGSKGPSIGHIRIPHRCRPPVTLCAQHFMRRTFVCPEQDKPICNGQRITPHVHVAGTWSKHAEFATVVGAPVRI